MSNNNTRRNNNSNSNGNTMANRASNVLDATGISGLFGSTNNNNAGSSVNKSNKSNNSKSSSMRMVVIVVVLIVVLYMLVKVMNYASGSVEEKNKYEPVLISTPVNAYDKSLSNNSVQVPNPVVGLELSYSFWIYVNDWDYKFGEWKNILVKGNTNGNSGVSPGIWLYPNTNALHARISTSADPNEGCDVQNIPLKKWVHVCYVLNNRSVDIYINGGLQRSCTLKGIPNINQADLHVCQDGGFYGQISRLQYFARAVSPTEVKNLYVDGPYGGMKYDVRFLQDGQVVNIDEHNGNQMKKYDSKYGGQ